MRMSADGENKLVSREGERLVAYRDTKHILTIGVGHTAAAGQPIPRDGMRITKDESRAILARDLAKFEMPINNAVRVTLAQNEFDALVSVCFNVGPKFASSTCIKRLNTGDRIGAAHAILIWNKPKEILGRRIGEMKQFSEAASRPEVLREGAAREAATATQARKQAAAAGTVAVTTQAGHAAPQAPWWGVAGLGIVIAIGAVVAIRKAMEASGAAAALEQAAKGA